MQKVFAVILFLISAVFSIKAVNVTAADSLEISYDCIYAVDWNVDIYPVANICTFPQESVDKVVDAMQSIQKIFLFGGNHMLCYYLGISQQEALHIKDYIENVDLPDGYKWSFGFFENEKQKLTLIIAVCELKTPFSDTIWQAFFEKDSFGNPSIGFSFRQGESEEPLTKYGEYRIQHKNNALVIEINGWLFAPTQINQLDIPNTQSITIRYVPICILEELYKPPFYQDLEVIVE